MDLVKTFSLSFSRFGLDASSEKLFYSMEDTADRWNFSYTFVLLCLMASVSTANVYFLRSFECTTVQEAPGGTNVKEFIQASCWTQGTVALTGNESTPSTPDDWGSVNARGRISFYQWVPFVLGLQAILFLIPHLIWDYMASHTFGEDTSLLLERSIKASKSDSAENRCDSVNQVASQITRICVHTMDTRQSKWAGAQRWLSRKMPGGRLLTVGKRLGNRIAGYYVITKLLYLGNLFGQLFLIQAFLTYGRKSNSFGEGRSMLSFAISLMTSLTEVADWEGGGSLLFPRRSYCVVNIRGLGARENQYLATCSLPVNMYNEKLYVFLWIWISLVLCITIISFFSWLIKLLFFSVNERFIRAMLMNAQVADCQQLDPPCSNQNLCKFINDSIRPDGVLVIRMIKQNAGAIIASEICLSAWKQFFEYNSRRNNMEMGLSQQRNFGFAGYQQNKLDFAQAPAGNNLNNDEDYAENAFADDDLAPARPNASVENEKATLQRRIMI